MNSTEVPGMHDKPKPIKGQSHWCEGKTARGVACRQVVLDTNDHCEAGHYNPIRTVPMANSKKTVLSTKTVFEASHGPGFSFEVEEVSEPPMCDICGAKMELAIDMSRVQAGIGEPRPTYICPNWQFHGKNGEGEISKQGEGIQNAESAEENPELYTCSICGAKMELAIDMSRVMAEIGGPRPTYVCPNWRSHRGEDERNWKLHEEDDERGEALERDERT
jgi:hypothetical protein